MYSPPRPLPPEQKDEVSSKATDRNPRSVQDSGSSWGGGRRDGPISQQTAPLPLQQSSRPTLWARPVRAKSASSERGEPATSHLPPHGAETGRSSSEKSLCCDKWRQPTVFRIFYLVLTPQENKKSVTLVYVKSEQYNHGETISAQEWKTGTSVLRVRNALHTTVRFSVLPTF